MTDTSPESLHVGIREAITCRGFRKLARVMKIGGTITRLPKDGRRSANKPKERCPQHDPALRKKLASAAPDPARRCQAWWSSTPNCSPPSVHSGGGGGIWRSRSEQGCSVGWGVEDVLSGIRSSRADVTPRSLSGSGAAQHPSPRWCLSKIDSSRENIQISQLRHERSRWSPTTAGMPEQPRQRSTSARGR